MSDDRYGYFSSPPAPPSQFGGGPPTAGPQPAFPPPAFPQQPGTPPAAVALPVAAGPRPPQVAALVALAALLAVLGGGAWWWTHRGDGLPDRLGPYARSTDPALTEAMHQGLDRMRQQVPSGTSVRAAAYGGAAGGAYLVEVDGPQVGTLGATRLPGLQPVGGSQCATVASTNVCLHSAGEHAVMVITLAGGTVDQTGLWTDQAWTATS